MKRLAVAACGALIGVGMAGGIGACDFFDCDTVDRPLLSGTYVVSGASSNGPHALVLDLEGGSAVETDIENGDDIRIEYSVGPDTPVR
jgi:hypothetical protein